MSALVVAAPVEIDATTYSRQAGAEVNPMLFLHGTDLYTVLVNTINHKVGIFKSADGAATWALQDDANAPTISGTVSLWASYNPATGIICVVTPTFGGGNQQAILFNTNTDTYAAPILGTVVAVEGAGAIVYLKSNGDFIFLYLATASGGLNYMVLSSGVFSGPTHITGTFGAFNIIYAGTVDSSDRAHFVYLDSSFGLSYNQVSSSFVLGSTVVIAVSFGSVDTIIWNSNIVVGYDDGNVVKVEFGTPLSGPTFSDTTVVTVGSPSAVSNTRLALDKDGNLVVFWVELDVVSTPKVDREWMSTWDGISAWGTPVLFYDEVDNPPAASQPQVDQFIHTGQFIQLSNGSWVGDIALETTHSAVDYCQGFSVFSPSTAPPTPPAPRPARCCRFSRSAGHDSRADCHWRHAALYLQHRRRLTPARTHTRSYDRRNLRDSDDSRHLCLHCEGDRVLACRRSIPRLSRSHRMVATASTRISRTPSV